MLKRHLPYHGSDHALCLAYNLLTGGTCIEDLEHLRTNEAVLDGLDAQRIPDPTTAGDFCRRAGFKRTYRMIVLRKRISVEKGQEELFEESRYFFYRSNDRTSTPAQIVLSANDRCDQENRIEQLKKGVRRGVGCCCG